MLKKLVKKYRIGRNVKFLGPVKHYGKKNIFSYYDICDIFSIASYHSEKFGMPCVEASLMGKPIVATDVFEENGVVVNGKTALVVPTRNSDELAKALIELLKDKKLRERLGKNARKFAERFKTINLSKEFEAVLKSNI
jgi:glycosyltransferase involved in cell wall biosynthesis